LRFDSYVKIFAPIGGFPGMDYKIISCDDHIDLQMLPDDLWTRRMASSMRDRAPRVEEREGRAVWVCEGKVWGPWFGRRREPGAARPASPVINAFDRSGITEQSDRRPGLPRCDWPTWTATVCKPT
jgi:hypothetical protein